MEKLTTTELDKNVRKKLIRQAKEYNKVKQNKTAPKETKKLQKVA